MERRYYLFMISLDKFSGSCNSFDDLYTKVYVPNETESGNVKVFNMITKINEAKTFIKHISYDCKWKFNIAICNSNHEWKYVNVSVKIFKSAKKTKLLQSKQMHLWKRQVF